MIDVPEGVIPVRDLTTREILYGPRTTTLQFELLAHNSSTGVDSLIGYLDGVQSDGKLTWSASQRVKKTGQLTVVDLAKAAGGLVRIADVNRVTTRIRPALIIEGLPKIYLSVYVITAAPESWKSTGRTFALELHDKSTVLDQDAVEETFTAGTSTAVLAIIGTVIQSAGERFTVDGSDTRKLAAPYVAPAGTSKLTIVNDLLKAIGYAALWVDDVGSFRATPYVRPAARPIRYAVLNDETGASLVRELTDGAQSIYLPDFSRDRDSYGVPNKVVAIQQSSGTGQPLSGSATNTDPNSEFSYAKKGRWITPVGGPLIVEVPDFSADVDPVASTVAFLNARAQEALIAMSAVQAAVKVSSLPIPLELLDAVRFASTPAGIDARHTVQRVELQLRFDGLMKLDLQEVIDL